MLDVYQQTIDKIIDPSLRADGIDVLIFAALCNALDAAAPDQEGWNQGAERFVESLEQGEPLGKAYFNALSAIAPDGVSWEAGINAIDHLANGMNQLALMTNNWTEGIKRARNTTNTPESPVPIDPRDKFLAQIQSTLKSLEKQNRKPSTFTDGEGNSVIGWVFEYGKNWSQDKNLNYSNSSGAFRETWGQDKIILTVDGEFYDYRIYCYDEKSGPASQVEEYRSNRLTKRPESWLVGKSGEPFSEIIAKLKRFPYTAHSY